MTDRNGPLVVVVALKGQLRGRLRRSVETLLDMGASVVVIAVDEGRDFRLGMRHPRLDVHYVAWPTPLRRARDAVARRMPQAREAPAARAGATRRPPLTQALQQRRRLAPRQVLSRAMVLMLPAYRILRWMAFWCSSARAVARLRPALVVSSDLPGLVGGAIGARRARAPHVHDCHELFLRSSHVSRAERLLLAPVERYFLRRTDAVVAVNASIAEEYRRTAGVQPVIVRNCVPRPRHGRVQDVRAMAGLPRDASVLLYQGGFSPGRGLQVAVSAACLLPRSVWLVLLGDGLLRHELEELARRRAPGRVIVLDAVPPDDLLAVTASADVGLVPYVPVSRNNTLALPNKIFEYVAAGLPVVSADLPELRRIAVDEGCGAVYEPEDPTSLAAAVQHLLRPEVYARAAASARRYGSENSWERERLRLASTWVSAAPEAGLRALPDLTVHGAGGSESVG